MGETKKNKTKKFLAEVEEKKTKKRAASESESDNEPTDDEMKDFIVDDDEVDFRAESEEEVVKSKNKKTKKRKLVDDDEEEEGSKNDESSSSSSASKAKKAKTAGSEAQQQQQPFGIIDVESTVANWYSDFSESVLNDEDQKKLFLEDFKDCDFISNYDLRFFADDEACERYKTSLVKKIFTQDRRRSTECCRELVRIEQACKIKQILAENGIRIVGFASESKRKSSSSDKSKDERQGSCHAIKLPSGFRREEDGNSKTGKVAKIVYVGEKSQIVKAKNNTALVPRVRINLLPKHIVYYPEQLAGIARRSAFHKMYEDLQARYPDVLLPLNRSNSFVFDE